MRTFRAVRVLLALLFLVGFSVVAAPGAAACACGAMPTREGARVRGEMAMITWGGRTETIDMIMRLNGRAAEAAWIMPTPAGTELSLGDKEVWDDLRDLTRAEQRTRKDWTPRFPFLDDDRGVGGSAPGSGVRVEGVAEIGPFRVTTLAGDSAAAVNDWLRENGFPAKDELLPTFQGYLDQGWRIQAVRLTPAAAGSALQGDLDPLRLRFPTDRVIYPIRLSKHAAQSQDVALYVVAPRRMDITAEAAPGDPMRLEFAGRVPGVRVGQPAGLVPGTTEAFLTAYVGQLSPRAITQDFAFGPAARDDAYREVEWSVDHSPGRALGWAITLSGLAVLAGLAAGAVVVRRGRGRTG
ncbi:DUF2330 domain-containing protein [Mariniluteicoccus flavus]